MTKQLLKLHQFYRDDIYWIKISALTAREERKPLVRIRHDDAVPKNKNTLRKVIEFHKIIMNDNREDEQVLVDLLSPANS